MGARRLQASSAGSLPQLRNQGLPAAAIPPQRRRSLLAHHGVDFEGKHREGGDDDPKWVERNAKLRTSRKVLFAGGLIPILQCHLCERVRMTDYLDTQLSTPPTDRLAAAFGHYGAIDEGVRFFAAYDRWIAILADAAARRELTELRFNTRDASGLFAEIREIGETLDQSLITLLFDTALSQVARKYAVL